MTDETTEIKSNPEETVYTSFELRANNRFLVSIPRIPSYLVHSYFPPTTTNDFVLKEVKFSLYESEQDSLYSNLLELRKPGIDKFDIDVSLLNTSVIPTEVHSYRYCYLQDFYYPPFHWDNGKIRKIDLTFNYTELVVD